MMTRRSLTVVLYVVGMLIGKAHAAQSDCLSDFLLTSCCDSDSSVDCGSCCCGTCGPCFEISGGYLYMAREYDRNTPVITSVSSGNTVVGMSDLEGDYDSGFEVRGRCSRLEVRYLQISNDVSAFAPATSTAQITYNGDGYFSSMVLDYDTELYSGEINLLCNEPTEMLRLSGGFRYLSLSEDIAASFPGFTGVIFTETRNDLYGLQLGLDADLLNNPSTPFSLICTTRAGAYYSDTRLACFPNAAGAVTLGSTSDSSERCAFVGELGLLGRVQVTPRITVDTGYNLLYITGVALAGDQSQRIDQQPLQPATSDIQNGEVLYHGLVTRATVSF